MTRRSAWARRAAWAAVVLACGAAVVVTVQQRTDVLDEAAASRTAAAADRTATAAAEDRLSDLQRSVAGVVAVREDDEAATRHIQEATAEIGVLRDRYTLTEDDLRRWRDVSVDNASQLEVLRGCVQTLDAVRTALVGGDPNGAAGILDRGRPNCVRAEELVDGIVDAVHPFDFPDPFVLTHDGTYYAFGTNGPAGTVQVVSSTDLDRWSVEGSALVSVPPWAEPGFTWAPAVARNGEGFVLYYTVRHKGSGKQCISVATGPAPAGPYVDRSTGPLVCQTHLGGSIDPSPYRDAAGTLYLTWKSEGETVGGASQIWSQALNPQGTAFTWFPAPLLTTDRDWEGRVIEAPSMALIDGAWVLLYSGNSWNTESYGIGYARCFGPMGPCGKGGSGPILRSDGDLKGPGGAEIFRRTDGALMIAYAGWDAGGVGPPNPRRLHLARLILEPEGLRIQP